MDQVRRSPGRLPVEVAVQVMAYFMAEDDRRFFLRITLQGEYHGISLMVRDARHVHGIVPAQRHLPACPQPFTDLRKQRLDLHVLFRDVPPAYLHPPVSAAHPAGQLS